MLNVEAALDDCFIELSKEYDIEEVDSIPIIETICRNRIWKVQIPALVLNKAEDIEAYLLFPSDFPYSMPCVIIPDDRFKYLPHISVKSRKLCLYEDGVAYDAENLIGLIRDNLDRTRKWIENYYGQDNSDEYAKEIRNYWNEQYDGENSVDDHWILLGDIPTKTCEMTGVVYVDKSLNNGNTYVMSVVASNEDDKTLASLKKQHKTRDIPVLFIASLQIPHVPPFCITGQELCFSSLSAVSIDAFDGLLYAVDNKAVANGFPFDGLVNGGLGTDGKIVLHACGRFAVVDYEFAGSDAEKKALLVGLYDGSMLGAVKGW